MTEVDYNIIQFHEKVQELMNKVRKAQKTIPDNLLMSLFTAYQTVPDETFNRFINNKKDKYTDEGMDLNPDLLMQAAEQKYYDLTTITKTWRAMSEADRKIAALTATVSSLKKQLKKGPKGTTPNAGSPPGSGKPPDQPEAKAKRPDWLMKQVKPRNINETRVWNNKTWRYCCPESGGKCKGKWVTHAADKCIGEAFRAKRNPDPTPAASGTPAKKKKQGTTVAQRAQIDADTIQGLQAALSQVHTEAHEGEEQE